MESVDAEVEIDMEISDDEQESCKGRVVAEQVVDDEGIKHGYPGDPSITSKTQFSRKRKWSAPVEITPSVRVEYHHLSKASRKKLQELLRDWSLWQGYHSRHSSSQSGKEEYYPALQVGPAGSSFSVSFWVDKPLKHARSKEPGDNSGLVGPNLPDLREGEADVPLYDRVISSLSSQEPRKDGCVQLEREEARCFNCGSYSHALRDCKRPWNYEAINSARSNHASKKIFSSGPRTASRYYEAHPSIEEPDRTPKQLYKTGEHGHLSSDTSKDLSRATFGPDKKEEKTNKLPNTDDNEEGEIVDDVDSSCVEELYIAFSPDATSQADRIPDFSGTRTPSSNSPPERTWRSPSVTYSPPSQMPFNNHHQRSFAYPAQHHPFTHTPPSVHYNGMNPPRIRDDRQFQRSWEDRNTYHYPEHSSSPHPVSAPSPPIAIPTTKKEEDDWELNFESSVYHPEDTRSFVGVPGMTEQYTPLTRRPSLTVSTIAGFSPPDPSQLSPTGSGYGDSFRPSPIPQTSVQYHLSYQSTLVRQPSCPTTSEAWEKAQAALSSLQSGENGSGR